MVDQLIEKYTDHPEAFLAASSADRDRISGDVRAALAALYEDAVSDPLTPSLSPLDRLHVDGFDAEQVWAEIELHNQPLASYVDKRLDELADRVADMPSRSLSPDRASARPSGENSWDSDFDEDDDDGDFFSGDDDGDDDGKDVHAAPAAAAAAAAAFGAGGDDDESSYSAYSDDGDGEARVRSRNPATEVFEEMAENAEEEREVVEARGGPSAHPAEDEFLQMSAMEQFVEEGERIGAHGGTDMVYEALYVDLEDTAGRRKFLEIEDQVDGDVFDEEVPKEHIKYSDFFDLKKEIKGGRSGKKRTANDRGDDAEDGGGLTSRFDSLQNLDGDDDGSEMGLKGLPGFGDEGDATDANPFAQSNFSRRQERIQKAIQELEAEALAAKPWVMTGEVGSRARPLDSLLGENLEFDRASRPAPLPTEELTASIEDIIRQRIRDETWDDVVRKRRDDGSGLFRQRVELDFTKSEKGLGEVLAEDYMQTTGQWEVADELAESHKEIEGLMDHLFSRLDALSNFHYAPRPARAELEIVTNAPAIEMEEVIPLAVSEATRLAPEEIFRPQRGGVTAEGELTREDRAKTRRDKKRRRRKKLRARDADRKIVARMNPGRGNKHARIRMEGELAAARGGRYEGKTATVTEGGAGPAFKSTDLFKVLQADARATIDGFKSGGAAEKSSERKSAASGFKL